MQLNKNETLESKNNTITNANRVKFSSDTTPLLREDSDNNPRDKNIDDSWLDEKGLVMDKNKSKDKNGIKKIFLNIFILFLQKIDHSTIL